MTFFKVRGPKVKILQIFHPRANIDFFKFPRTQVDFSLNYFDQGLILPIIETPGTFIANFGF